MTAAGLRLSRKANAVSKLHGNTAREMWKLIPGGSDILSITNGVHNGTWQDENVRQVHASGGDLWAAHRTLKRVMIEDIERRNGVRLDENVLTIGFARRATPYKRSDLIFSNREIIGDLLRSHKVQIVLSGKAHPNDMEGKATITNLVRIAREYPDNVVFVQGYDMSIGKMLTRGCDVWLNNPVRPMEASGTSGMKAAMNGVLNLSTLDGWWPEACKHGVNGWQFGGDTRATTAIVSMSFRCTTYLAPRSSPPTKTTGRLGRDDACQHRHGPVGVLGSAHAEGLLREDVHLTTSFAM